MPRVSVIVGGASAAAGKAPRSPRVSLVGETGISLSIPVQPKLNHEGLARRYATFERVLRKPLLTEAGDELRKYSLTLLMVGRDQEGRLDYQVSVERQLQILRSLARGMRVMWSGYGPSEGGWFRITQHSVQEIQRNESTNEITVAEVTLELTEAVSAVVRVGPLTGGVAVSETALPQAAAAATETLVTHVVAPGDSLTKVAAKHRVTPKAIAKKNPSVKKAHGWGGPRTPPRRVLGKVIKYSSKAPWAAQSIVVPKPKTTFEKTGGGLTGKWGGGL